MTIDDVALLVRWDDDSDAAAAIGGRGADWCDWSAELVRDAPWPELLIVEEDVRPIGFLQLIDTSDEESHYWGDSEPGTWAIDIWIGSPHDRGRGLGAETMKLALGRVFDQHDAEMVVIDPAVDNRRDRVLRAARLRAQRDPQVRRLQVLGDAPVAELHRLTLPIRERSSSPATNRR